MANFWQSKNVFITGANGFLGGHLTDHLLKSGANITALVYEDNPDGVFDERGLASHVDAIRGDIRDLAQMERIIKEKKIDTVYHLAAQAIVDQALEDPLATFEANIQGTWNILEAGKKNSHVERVVVASSDKAYGEHEALPYIEHTHHLRGTYPYEVSKSCADLITQSFHKAFGLPVAITRCGNLYGPGDLKLNRIVPRTISQLHTNNPPIIRDTGESLRDYLFVEDAVEGYRVLAEKLDDHLYGHAFNLSTNAPLSVSQVIKTISDVMGKEIEPTVMRTHGMEIRNQYASFEKAKRLLDWEPRHDFAAGLRKTIPWYQEYLDRVYANSDAGLLSA
jgi:CDP-glucose 4,6-dehydratase